MRACFVDTSGWGVLVARDERGHAAAAAFEREWTGAGGIFVSTDYVLDETLTMLRARHGLGVARKWWDGVSASSRVRWEGVGAARAARARDWFFQWADQEFSLTDCSSFVVMRELGLRRAMTTDHHFAVAGFDTVPPTTKPRKKRQLRP